MLYKTTVASPLVNITLASDGTALTGLWFEGQKYYMGTWKEPAVENNDLAIFHQTKQWLCAYFAGKQPDMGELYLKPAGTVFQKRIWEELLRIPYGETRSYGDLAASLQINSAQAVGSGVAHNPISIIIPCHRVIAKNGSLTGYAGGIEKKKYLLQLEQVDMSGMFSPDKKTVL